MNRLKIIIKNGESVDVFSDASDVQVYPKSKLVKTFNDDGSMNEEFQLVDKKIELKDDFENDKTEIIVTLDVTK